MNFSVTAVFSPLERAELKKRFHQQKRMEAQLNKVSQQAARSYRSTLQVRRVPKHAPPEPEPEPQPENPPPPTPADPSPEALPASGSAAPAGGTG